MQHPPNPARPHRQRAIITGILAGSAVVSIGLVTALWYPYSSPPGAPITEDAATTSAAPVEDSGPEPFTLGWAADQVDAGFVDLETAFAEGDREAWMSEFYLDFTGEYYPEGELEAQVGLYFDNLQALEATSLEIRLLGSLTEVSPRERQYSGRVGLSFCLAPADPETCVRSEVDYDASWHLRGETLHLTRLRTDFSKSYYRPQAWEEAELSVAVGDRAVVATAADSGYDPADYLTVAEEAAANADSFGFADVPSYVVILAEEDQYNDWYGDFDMHGKTAGYAAWTSADIQTAYIAGPLHTVIPVESHGSVQSVGNTLRHEFGHVVSLQGTNVDRSEGEAAWAVEGVAEYVAEGDTMPSDRVSDTQALVASGGCDSNLAAPDFEDSRATISGIYGCLYLAVRYLIHRYGQQAFMDWFEAMFRDGAWADIAAQEHFGSAYSDVMDDIAAYIRDEV